MSKSKNIQMDIGKREVISNGLKDHLKAKDLANLLNVHTTTISREILNYRKQVSEKSNDFTICCLCNKYLSCHYHHICGSLNCFGNCKQCTSVKNCSYYHGVKCEIENRYPFVCNNCDLLSRCKKSHFIYDFITADKRAKEIRRDCRKGIDLTEEEYKKLNSIIKEGNEKGQSIYHIVNANKDSINKTVKTVYNYVNNNYLEVKRIDLPQAVKLKIRSKKKSQYEYSENKNIDRIHRMYSDWLVFQAKNKIITYWQMDFLGAPHKSEQQILVLSIPKIQFVYFLPILYPNLEKVKNVFDDLENKLGDDFSKVFEAILTDRDCKFNSFKEIEINDYGVVRTHVFFCDPLASNQKPNVENENGQLRATFKKSQRISEVTWDHCNLISSNYNSRFLNSIDGKSPIDLFVEIFGENILTKLGLKRIEPKKVKILPLKNYKLI